MVEKIYLTAEPCSQKAAAFPEDASPRLPEKQVDVVCNLKDFLNGDFDLLSRQLKVSIRHI